MQDLTALACGDFLSALAGPAAAPGGGGVSALAGALGVALGNMVGSLTVGKPKYAAVEPENPGAECAGGISALPAGSVDPGRCRGVCAGGCCVPDAPGYPRAGGGKGGGLGSCLGGSVCSADAGHGKSSAQGIALAEQYAAKGSVLAVSDAGCAAVFVLDRAALRPAESLRKYKIDGGSSRAKELNAQAETLLTAWTGRAESAWRQTAKDLGGEGECLSC